jgi:hypothetical protein
MEFIAQLRTIQAELIILLPPSISAQLPSRGMVLVEGIMTGHSLEPAPFQAVLEPDGQGSHWFSPKDELIQGLSLQAGEAIQLDIQVSKNWPEPELPQDILRGLAHDPGAQILWSQITPMARWDWLRWIRSTKNPATRAKRIQVTKDKLLRGERRPCCFNRNLCTVPELSHRGVLRSKEE